FLALVLVGSLLLHDTPTPQISPLSLHDALPISFLILVTPTPGAAGAFLCPSSSVRGRPFHRTERQFAALISWSRRDPDSECVVASPGPSTCPWRVGALCRAPSLPPTAFFGRGTIPAARVRVEKYNPHPGRSIP